MRVLITGGAGFIGSHLADALIDAGHSVRVLDSLDPQVHGDTREPPDDLSPKVEFFYGDVRDDNAVHEALKGIDVVYHFAAKVGVGQSMYEIGEYTSVNTFGTGVLLDAFATPGIHSVKKLIVASSMSVYGEGAYTRGSEVRPFGTSEDHQPGLPNVYALTKYDQERLCLIAGQAYGIPTTALRFFNVYGPRQALSNPYTGVIAIFASRLLNGKPPLIYEDGLQSRDFVSVYDIAHACMLALHSDATGVFNVGSGVRSTVLDVAQALARVLGVHIEPEFTGTKRKGDIRHCFADISKARDVLGYKPMVTLDDGLADLAVWLRAQERPADRVEDAAWELATRGLVA